MNMTEKHQSQQLAQNITPLEIAAESRAESTPNVITPILRRWYIVLITFLVIIIISIPAIWFGIEPLYFVTGALRVAPILPNILTGEADRGEISNYQSFMRTQAEMITSNQVVQRVADNLIDKDLLFLENETNGPFTRLKRKLNNNITKPEPASVLKKAIYESVISVDSARFTELIKVTMKSANPTEAKQIVNAFINAYMAVEVSSSAQSEDRKLNVLEDERKVLAEKLQNQRETIRQLAQEYGTTALEGRQDMMLHRVTTLLYELTKLEAHRISLEAQVQLLEQTKEQAIAPEDLLKMRNDYINSDPTVQELTRNIVQFEQDLITAKQILAPTNPAIKQKQRLLDAFQARLEEKREEIATSFDDIFSEAVDKASKDKLLNTRTELEQTRAYENRLREVLAKEDTQTIQIGRKQLQMEDLQFQLDLDKEMYDTVCRRIREMEMERKRPARVSIAYNADIVRIRDKRVKYTIVIMFAAMACGAFLALLRDKVDYSLYTPDDVTKRIGVRIIGTTTSSDYVDAPKLPEQVVNDYQTIRANLGLLNGGKIPKKLVITSAGMREGKTTLAINLATSLARAGKKILLIDGDLRKPDIRRILNLPKNSRGLEDVLKGKNFENAVHSVPSEGFDVLAANSQNRSDSFELLSQPHINEYLNLTSQKYDHVIIDTPPILAFPDALLWAKIADGVILTSFAGHTEEQDLKETLGRLAQIKVRILGTVLNNVRTNNGYYRYGYGHYADKAETKISRRKSNKTLLLLPAKESNKNIDDKS